MYIYVYITFVSIINLCTYFFLSLVHLRGSSVWYSPPYSEKKEKYRWVYSDKARDSITANQ